MQKWVVCDHGKSKHCGNGCECITLDKKNVIAQCQQQGEIDVKKELKCIFSWYFFCYNNNAYIHRDQQRKWDMILALALVVHGIVVL